MNNTWFVSPIASLISAMISAVVALSISLYFGPRNAERRATARQLRAWKSHLRDTIRDFRESHAVLASISAQNYTDAYPLQNHITKCGIPDQLLTSKVVVIGDLNEVHRERALHLENLLVNINRDIATIVRLVEKDRRPAFEKAIGELADKFYNLANRLLRESPDILPPAQSSRAKEIHYEDAKVLPGIAFELQEADREDPRLKPGNSPLKPAT